LSYPQDKADAIFRYQTEEHVIILAKMPITVKLAIFCDLSVLLAALI